MNAHVHQRAACKKPVNGKKVSRRNIELVVKKNTSEHELYSRDVSQRLCVYDKCMQITMKIENVSSMAADLSRHSSR